MFRKSPTKNDNMPKCVKAHGKKLQKAWVDLSRLEDNPLGIRNTAASLTPRGVGGGRDEQHHVGIQQDRLLQ